MGKRECVSESEGCVTVGQKWWGQGRAEPQHVLAAFKHRRAGCGSRLPLEPFGSGCWYIEFFEVDRIGLLIRVSRGGLGALWVPCDVVKVYLAVESGACSRILYSRC